MAIYVKFEKPRTIKEFLIKFYTSKNFDYSESSLGASNTYSDKECKVLQCDRRSRSFDELLEILQTYYPSTTPKICMYHLLTVQYVNKKGKRMYPYLGTCGGMNRIKYLPYHDKTALTSAYFDTSMRESKYTWRELLKLLNIKNITELKTFINY